jgi:hypothetical protein
MASDTKGNPEEPGFAITNHKGFRLLFPNGITISVQWGPGNYCEAGDITPGSWDAPKKSDWWESADAEIALLRDDQWITEEAYAHFNPGEILGDDVLGRVSPEEVASYVAWAAAQPPAPLREHGEDERKAAQGGEP